MEFLERAKIRMEHWVSHNEQHQKEYEALARELAEAGKKESADHILDLIELTAKNSECIRKAVKALE